MPLPGGATPYPKGNLQIWHTLRSGFAETAAGAELLALADAARSGEGAVEVKPKVEAAAEAPPAAKAQAAVKAEAKPEAKLEDRKRQHPVETTHRGGRQKAPKRK